MTKRRTTVKMPLCVLAALGALACTVASARESVAAPLEHRWVYLATNLLVDRNVEDAAVLLERAAKAAPDDIRVRIALGWCYKRTGRLDRAIDALEQALLVEPEEPLLRYNLACYLSLAGRKRRALRYLSQAFAIDPAYRELAEVESDFDSLRNDPEFQAICAGVNR